MAAFENLDDGKEHSSSSSSEEHDSANYEKVYTVNEAIDKLGLGPFQILVTVFCGILWLADAMEFMILSVLSPAVKCQWDLSAVEEAVITSVVFLGLFFGCFFWGVVFDSVGRKMGLFMVNVVVLVFAALSALQVSADDGKIPGYPWLLVCRFGLGFGAGGTGQSVTYYVEFLPVKGRGIFVVLMEVWWAFGGIFGAVLAIAVLGEGHLNWHWYLGLAAIPLALAIFLFPFVPESPRFYLVKGKLDKARKVIERVAWFNCKTAPPGRLVFQEEKDRMALEESTVVYSQGSVTISDNSSRVDITNNENGEDGISVKEEVPLLDSEDTVDFETISKPLKFIRIVKGKFSPFFSAGMWKTTLLLIYIWSGASWLYYGIILLTTSLLQYDPHCDTGSTLTNNFSNATNDSTTFCEGSLDTSDYIKIVWTSAAELPGVFITVAVIEILGRKLTVATEFVAAMIGFLLLFICTSEYALTAFLFAIRGFATGLFQAIYVYTPEVYPTEARAFALGMFSSVSRIGGMVTPFVAQVLLHASDYATFSLYAGTSLSLAIAAILLPIETKGRALKDRE